MNTDLSEVLTPFSSELLSEKTLKEIKKEEQSSLYSGYNPNDDNNASELGGDIQEVPLGDGFSPLLFAIMIYALKNVLKNRFFRR